MTLLKLTPQNQLRRFHEDVERMNAGRKMDYSIGQHVELLIKRVAALEAAQGIEAQRAETVEQGSVHESPVANGDAPNLSHPSQEGQVK